MGAQSRQIPAGLSGVIAIAAGVLTVSRLRATGRYLGWGNISRPNDHSRRTERSHRHRRGSQPQPRTQEQWDGGRVGRQFLRQTTVPAGLTGVTAIAAGHTTVSRSRAMGRSSGGGSGQADNSRRTERRHRDRGGESHSSRAQERWHGGWVGIAMPRADDNSRRTDRSHRDRCRGFARVLRAQERRHGGWVGKEFLRPNDHSCRTDRRHRHRAGRTTVSLLRPRLLENHIATSPRS